MKTGLFIVVALLALVSGFVVGAIAVYVFMGDTMIVAYVLGQFEGALTMVWTGSCALFIIMFVRLPMVQNFMGSAYEHYRAIQDTAADRPVSMNKAQLAKAYAFSSSTVTAAVLQFIGVVVAAQIVARAIIVLARALP